MSCALVANPSSTTTPRLTATPACAASVAFGRTPTATTTRSAAMARPSLSSTASTRWLPAIRAVSASSITSTPRAALGEAVRGLEAEEAAADHDDAGARPRPHAHRVDVADVAESHDAVEID